MALVEEEPFYFKSVLSVEVEKVMVSIPINKDPIKVIRDCLPYVLGTITGVINLSFESCMFPQAWKKVEVVLLVKDGDHEVPNNNQPISLLAECIVLHQLMYYLINKQKLTCHQSGNRQFNSTETLSLYVTKYLCKTIDEKKITAIILIDSSEAFDSLSYNLLLHKLQDLGISEPCARWFNSYLTERYQTTCIGCSSWCSLGINSWILFVYTLYK